MGAVSDFFEQYGRSHLLAGQVVQIEISNGLVGVIGSYPENMLSKRRSLTSRYRQSWPRSCGNAPFPSAWT